MVSRITFSKGRVQLNNSQLHKLSEQNISIIWLNFRIGTSFGRSEDVQLPEAKQNEQENVISFITSCRLYSQGLKDNLQIFLFGRSGSENKMLASEKLEIQTLLEGKQIPLDEVSGSISLETQHQVLQNVKTMEIRNTIIEMLSSETERMKLEYRCSEDIYHSNNYETKLFWSEVINIFVTQQTSLTMSLVKENGEKQQLCEIQFNEFSPGSGFKRNLVTNESQFPVGCIAFEYKINGEWNYGQDKVAELLCNEELYKIQILKIRGKVKEASSQWGFKIVSDINKLDLEAQSSEMSDHCQAEINRHIYSCEPKCNFMVFCIRGDEEFVCNGAMNLQMIGKFQKRVAIKDLKNNQTIGHLFVHTQCLKVDTVTIKFKKIHLKILNCNNCHEKEVFIKGEVGGCFGKTEKQKVEGDIRFVKNLQMKFSKESFVDLVINSPDQTKTQHIEIQLKGLEDKKDKTVVCQFGGPQSYLQGILSCEYQFVPRESGEKENKIQQQLSGYDENLVMEEGVRQNASMLKESRKKKQEELCKHAEEEEQSKDERSHLNTQVLRKKSEEEVKKQTTSTEMQKEQKGGRKLMTSKEKEQVVVNLQNHLTKFKVTKRNKSSKGKQDQKKSPSRVNSRDLIFKKQSVEAKFQHIINVYMGDKNNLRKNHEKALNKSHPQKQSSYKKAGRAEIDLPEIKIYRSQPRHQVSYHDSYLNKKRYLLPAPK